MSTVQRSDGKGRAMAGGPASTTPGPFDLDGRTAIVTGGNQGIGQGIASALAAAGAGVAIWGRSRERNEQARDVLIATGAHASAHAVDVADEAAVTRAFEETVAAHGKVDIAVASAGVSAVVSSSADMTMEEWRRVLAVDLDGVMLTFRETLRHLVERGAPGSLVAIGSRLSANGQPRAPHYSAAKAGLEGLVRALAREYGGQGVRANVVHPGWIQTPMTESVLAKPRVAEQQLPRIPLGRWGTPADLGGIVVYLASDASSYHTGDVIRVDGGDGLG
jgi:NAD(P)-dependent dehydrogenase (short-subunit alcohol dehydrogenase family)